MRGVGWGGEAPPNKATPSTHLIGCVVHSKMDRSISEYFYDGDGPAGHRCGYCKSEDTNVSQGMWTHLLTVEDYQDLIDRGWRRSGKYCYKPIMYKTCCPMYTISCSATKFSLSRSQKKVLKNVNKYLVEGIGEKRKDAMTNEDKASSGGDLSTASATTKKLKKVIRPGIGADSSKPPCRKAKILRQELKAKKKDVSSQATDSVASVEDVKPKLSEESKDKSTNSVSSIPDFLKIGSDGKKPLEAFLTLPPSKNGSSYAHNLEVKLIKSSPPSAEFKATFLESYSVFKKYQMAIHKEAEDEWKESGFTRFLCDSPLIPIKGQEGWPCDYGSYHQHYRVDGRLVAVGVIDILPKCVSSVYVYYDPEYYFLNLGVYSALKEIEMTRKLHLSDPSKFKYYYMGYYIHSCQKMRYKGNYSPSFLLCPESYSFIPIEVCLPKLDSIKYSRLNDNYSIPEDVDNWLKNTLVLKDRKYLSYGNYCLRYGRNNEAKVKEYAGYVGPKVATRMLLFLQ